MYTYVVCLCGFCIGQYTDLYQAMKADKLREVLGNDDSIDPKMVPISLAGQVALNEIFEALNINHACCRARLLSQVEIRELY